MSFKSRYRYVVEAVPRTIAKVRALNFLSQPGQVSRGLTPNALVAKAIWPGHTMRPQGAALAAGRVLKALETDGKVRYVSGHGSTNGWAAT
jgi:hypothetical protein